LTAHVRCSPPALTRPHLCPRGRAHVAVVPVDAHCRQPVSWSAQHAGAAASRVPPRSPDPLSLRTRAHAPDSEYYSGEELGRYLDSTWEKWSDSIPGDTTTTATSTLGMFLSRGNHHGAGLHGSTPSNTSRFFSVDLGLVHLIALDFNVCECSPPPLHRGRCVRGRSSLNRACAAGPLAPHKRTGGRG
jgi:hypothetical protein